MSDLYFLSKGNHPAAGPNEPQERCALEWISYLAGEKHSDHPVCVSPLLRGYGIALNDLLPDDLRQRLRPLLARCIGTAGDGRDSERSWLAADWLIRTHVPAFMALTPSLAPWADELRALPAVLTPENLTRAMESLEPAWAAADAAAWDAARAADAAAGDAAWDAARTAAWTAAWDAARTAAWDAAGDAAVAATRDAAGAAAGAAAWDAAVAAARDAAGAATTGDALAPTVRELQISAIDLLHRMLPTELLVLPVAADADLICDLEWAAA